MVAVSETSSTVTVPATTPIRRHRVRYTSSASKAAPSSEQPADHSAARGRGPRAAPPARWPPATSRAAGESIRVRAPARSTVAIRASTATGVQWVAKETSPAGGSSTLTPGSRLGRTRTSVLERADVGGHAGRQRRAEGRSGDHDRQQAEGARAPTFSDAAGRPRGRGRSARRGLRQLVQGRPITRSSCRLVSSAGGRERRPGTRPGRRPAIQTPDRERLSARGPLGAAVHGARGYRGPSSGETPKRCHRWCPTRSPSSMFPER